MDFLVTFIPGGVTNSFTCLCCWAVHIEPLKDMATDAFINALQCFTWFCGAVRNIRSNQGSNFMSAKNEIAKALEVDKNKAAAYLADKQPWLPNENGGLKQCWRQMKRAVQDCEKCLEHSPCPKCGKIWWFLYEAMSIVYNCPLTVNSISYSPSIEQLTPNHLITMKFSIPLPFHVTLLGKTLMLTRYSFYPSVSDSNGMCNLNADDIVRDVLPFDDHQSADLPGLLRYKRVIGLYEKQQYGLENESY